MYFCASLQIPDNFSVVMAYVPLRLLGMYLVLLTSVPESTTSSMQRPEDWTPETLTLPPLPMSLLFMLTDYCEPGANLSQIALDDCGSCHDRCGALNTMSPQDGLCSCDSACMVYDDCCWDFHQKCPELHEMAMDTLKAFENVPSAICFRMDVQNLSLKGRTDVLLINNCGGTTDDIPAISGIPDLYTQVPVLDLDTGIFYINLNCAICNRARRLQATEVHLKYEVGVDEAGLHPSNTKTTTTAVPTLLSADEVMDALEVNPRISYFFPGTPARQCHRDVVDHCREGCANSQLVDLCRTGGQSYTLKYRGSTPYRNLYCALCNVRPIMIDSCSKYSSNAHSGSTDLSIFSLSFLFDLHELESPSLHSVSFNCFMNDIGLPDGVVCGETVCPKGYMLQGDTCITSQVSPPTLSKNETQSIVPCQGFRLPKSAFNIENGTLIMLSNSLVYDEGEFVLENASAVVCQNHTHINISANSALVITTIVLCSISLMCLVYRLTLQAIWRKYNSFPGRMQSNLVLAMALAIALLLLSPLASDVDKLCFTLGVLKYFAFLASFVWMTCVAGDTWRALGRSRACQHPLEGPSLRLYMLIGWLLPSILTITLLLIDLSKIGTRFAPQFGGSSCWITQKLPLILFFFVPFFVNVVLNIGFFLLTMRQLKTAFKESNVLRKSNDTQHPWKVYLKLFIIMGLAWLVGFVAIWADSVIVWFLFVILNASQGIFIFVAFVLDLSRIKRMFICCDRRDILKENQSSTNEISTETSHI